MSTEKFQDVIAYLDKSGEVKAYDTVYGKIAIYEVDTINFGNYMIYYGDYEGDIRSGNGVWLGYKDQNNYYVIGS